MSAQIGIRLLLEGASQAEAGINRVRGAVTGLSGALAGAFSAGAFVQAADSITLLNNQLKLATGSVQAAAAASAQLFEIAQRSSVSFTELGTTFAAITRAGDTLGLSQSRLLNVAESISNAMSLSGGQAASMQAALVQLGQGLSSGVLRGEELNSIMEQTPRLARAIADGLNVPIGKLREMGATGQLTSEQVIKSLESQYGKLRDEVASGTLTVGNAMTQIQNAAVKAAGEIDKSTGATAAMVTVLRDLSGTVSAVGRAFADNETVVKTTLGALAGAAAAAGIAATVASMTTMVAAAGGLAAALVTVKASFVALTAAMAANPFGLLAIGIATATGALIAYQNAQAGTATGMRQAITDMESANNSLLNLKGQAGMTPSERAGYEARLGKIAALKTSLGELDRQFAAKNAPIGSAPSGDVALARAQAADLAKRQAELAKLMGELATPQEKLNKALADAKAKLGDLYTPEVAKRITDGFIKPTQGAAKATDELANAAERGTKALAAMVAKDAGLSPDFASDWADLAAAYQKGRINLQQLTSAQADLLAQQPAMVESAKAQADAIEQLAKAEFDRINAVERSADSAADRLQQMQDEERAVALAAAQNISLAQAVEEVTIARLREQQAALMREGDRDSEVLALQREIDTRKQLIAAIGTRDTREASEKSAEDAKALTEKTAKDAADEWQKTADSINQSLTDALMRGFESGKDFGKNLKDTLVNMFKTMVLRPTISAILAPVAGALGGTANAAGGGVGGQDLTSLFSQMNSSVSNTIGTAFNKFATSSTGQSLGLSTTPGMEVFPGQGPSLTSAGQSMGTALGVVGDTLAGYAMGSMARSLISNGYSAGKGMDNFQKVGIAVGSAIGGPVMGAIIGAGAGVFNQVFGRKLKDSGIEGTFGGQAGFTGSSFEFMKGGLLRSDKTNRSDLDPEIQKAFAGEFNAMRVQVGTFATALSLETDRIAGFTSTIKLSLKGLSPEDADKKIAEALATTNNALAEQVLGSYKETIEKVIDQIESGEGDQDRTFSQVERQVKTSTYTPSEFARDGEKAIDTLNRLSVSLINVNGVFDAFGATLYESSLAGGDLASKLVDAFGGLDNFASATSSYYEAFYSEQERTETGLRKLAGTLGELGIALPDATASDALAQYRALVDAQDLNTEAGRKAYATLVTLGGGFAQLAEVAGGSLKALLTEQKSLEIDLLEAQGNTAEATRMRLRMETLGVTEAEAAAYRYNAALRDQITALGKATEAQKSAMEKYAAPITATSAAAALGPDVMASIAGKSADGIRGIALAYVSGLDAQTASGQAAIAAFEKLTPAIDFFIDSAETAATKADELAKGLVESFGISANEISATFLDVILGRQDATKAGEAISKMVSDGIYNSLASGFSQQITQIMVQQLITPMVQAAGAGTSISAAVSKDAISNMLAAAKNASEVLGQLFADEDFQSLMTSISAGISGATQALVTPIADLAPAADTAAASVESLGNALGRFGDSLDLRADLFSSTTQQNARPTLSTQPTTVQSMGVASGQLLSATIDAELDVAKTRIQQAGVELASRLTYLNTLPANIDFGDGGSTTVQTLITAARERNANVLSGLGSQLEFLARDFETFFTSLNTFGTELESTLAEANDSAVGKALNLVAISKYFTDVGVEIAAIQTALANAQTQLPGSNLAVSAATSGFATNIGSAATQIGAAISASILAGVPEAIRNDPALAGVSASMLAVIGSVGEGDVQGVNDSFLILSGALTRGELTAAQYAAAIGFVTDSFTGAAESAAAVVDQLNIRKGLERQILELTGDTAAIRLLEIAGMDAANVALYDRVQALQAEAEQAEIRKGMERQILELTGDTAALRLLDIAGMSATNVLLYDRVQGLKAEAAAREAVAKGASDAMSALQRSVDAQRKIVEVARDAAAESVSEITSVFDILKSSVKELYGSVDSTAQMQADEGRAFITQALATAQSTGYLPDSKELTDAINAAKGGNQEFASQFEKDFAALTLAGDLSLMEKLSKDQLTEAQRALKAQEDQLDALDGILTLAQQQLDAANGINNSVLSLKDALAAFAGALVPLANPVMGKYDNAYGKGSTSAIGVDPATSLASGFQVNLQAGYVVLDSDGGIALGVEAGWTAAQVAAQVASNITSFGADSAKGQLLADWASAQGIPGFANGGMFGGGARIVGERGPELEITGPSRIFDAATTGRMLGGNTDRLEKLVEGLTAEVQRLQTIVNDGNKNTRRTADAVNGRPEVPMPVENV